MFPDYYVIVENPIGLEDIKAKIEKGGYPTLEAVRQDFQLCFNNAKKYNLKDSIICKDGDQEEEDVREATHYMHQKYSGDEQSKESSADETEDEWQGPVWGANELSESKRDEPSSCLIILDGFVVDVTPYLREHVRVDLHRSSVKDANGSHTAWGC